MITVLADLANNDGYNHMWGGGAWSWAWGAVMMVAMVGLAAGLIVWLVRGGASQASAIPPADPTFEAKSILANRLANGEVSPEEYHERLTHLK